MKPPLFPGERTVCVVRSAYKVLFALYPDKRWRQSQLSSESTINKGNLSKLLKSLKSERLVEEEQGNGVLLFKLTEKAKIIVGVLIDAEKAERPKWKPIQEEVALSLNALKEKGNDEIVGAARAELSATLEYGYWDSQLESHFTEALNNPKSFLEEITYLFRSAFPKNKEQMDFLTKNKSLLFKMVLEDIEGHTALGLYLKLSGDEALKELDDALKGSNKNSLIVMTSLRSNSLLFYERFGMRAKQLLYEVLKHRNTKIRGLARSAIEEITGGPKP